MSMKGAPRRPLDLRSDTGTLPTPQMYEAMRTVPLGDDGFRDDPTALLFEERAAELLGKEASVFLPSGTMADLVALMALNDKFGGELIAHSRAWIVGGASHGGFATLAALAPRRIDGPRGMMDLEALEEVIDPIGHHRAPHTAIVSIENTHTFDNGAVLPLEHMQAVHAIAAAKGVPVFLDGARLPHAAAELGLQLADFAGTCDMVAMSLCKALGAPAGAVLAGTREMIDKALIYRKMLGGGMRQTGLLAACALVAIETPMSTIRRYHDLAKRMAKGLSAIDPGFMEPDAVETNLLTPWIAHTGLDSSRWVEELAHRGILVSPAGPRKLRLLTHFDVDEAAVDATIAAFAEIMRDHARPVS